MLQLQYDIFEESDESQLKAIEEKVAQVALSSDKVRKGLYAKTNELHKVIMDLEERLKIMERNICYGKN